MSAVVDGGLITADSEGATDGFPKNIVACAGKEWIPGQWKPGLRQYYVEIGFNDPATAGQIYKIVDNTETELTIERDPDDANTITRLTSGLPTQYAVFCDRMVSLGEFGLIRPETTHPSLVGSRYQYTRWIRVRIPQGNRAEGYHSIESIVLGRHVPVQYTRGQRSRFRDQMNSGGRWQAIPSTVDNVGLSGAKTVRHLGRPQQQWRVAYNNIYEWDRDRTLSPFYEKMRRPFAIVFDDENRVPTLEYVRLTTDLPQSISGSGELASFELELEEVI